MRGFTLIELIVVLGIIGLVSGVVFTGVRAGERALLLDRAANALAQDIRLAMDYTLQARPFTGDCADVGGPTGTGSPNPMWKERFLGYTVVLEENTTTYNIQGLCRIENPSGSSNWRRLMALNPPQDFQLESGGLIADIDFRPRVRVNFYAPDPTVEITEDEDSAPAIAASVIVTIALEDDPTKTRIIKITHKGVIEIQ